MVLKREILEEQLAELVEKGEVRIDGYRLSDYDRRAVSEALRFVVNVRDLIDSAERYTKAALQRCPECDKAAISCLKCRVRWANDMRDGM